MNNLSKVLLVLGVVSSSLVYSGPIDKAIEGDHRSEENKQRDEYRNPKETLEFFGFKPDMTVVEIWPGGGWYTEILAPVLKEKGQYIAGNFDPESDVKYYTDSLAKFKKNFVSEKSRYGNVKLSVFAPPGKVEIAEPGTADMVLTFRNVHNWYMRGGEEGLTAAFEGFYKALKPGGVLGVVEHRLPKGSDPEKQASSGYMLESWVIKWAEKAGFELAASSDINANPKDTADHPKGVWTLPPRLRLGEKDKEKYLSIGESDRMTLKFVKPIAK
ncbi:class I SAM-dependent methyltransferase [Pleionea sediminis]|uniref:class I SAM-dependent methyltransferase n=1 Tax=Pleionea sediminis TaxID=2569479 RepID=UPI001185150E|nr:class I SAM-dependent methyltransferase [Pleionea sediminis]